MNPDALSIAAHLDALRKNGTILGPLHGIPILIKNNIATDDLMNTTAGSFALIGAKVPRDATVAAKLRQAGAIILGKTNLSQWANFRSSNSSNGWSATGGQTYAAYHPLQDPSGSSSGSGVASSLGLALASLGTETSGSILSPAGVNNLVGIKPTVGLTSRHLVIPISEHQDTVGPMARTVKDAAYLLQAIAGRDSYDNYTLSIPNDGKIPDYVAACNYSSLRGARLGVPYNVLELSELDAPVLEAFHLAIDQIRKAGATIVEANFTAYEAFAADETGPNSVSNADFLSSLPAYFSLLTENPYNLTSLSSLRNFTQNFPGEEFPSRDTAIWDEALAQGWNNTDPRFWPAYQKNLYYGGEGGVLGALNRTGSDAILLPTQISAGVAAIVGSPVITVPMGFYPSNWNVTKNSRGNLVATGPNVPFGLSFMGDRFGEEGLIGLAYAWEQRTGHRGDVGTYVVPRAEVADVLQAKGVGLLG